MMKSNNIVKILHMWVTAITLYARGRINADLFVLDYIRNTAPTPPYLIVWKERVLLFVASFFITFKIT